MSVQLTPGGQAAYAAVQRAFDDHAYIAAARQQLAVLVRIYTSGPDAKEISDAATMLERLASSLPAPARTISSQMGGVGADSESGSSVL